MTLHHPDYVDIRLVVFGRQGIVAGFNIFIGADGFQSITMMLMGGPLHALGYDIDHEPETLILDDANFIMGCSAHRREITDDERLRIRQAGFRHQGRGDWPQLLRATVGFLPHPLDQHETLYTAMAIYAAVDVASRIRRREFDPKPWRDFANLLRLTRRDDAWQTEWREPPPPTSATQTLHISLSKFTACPTRPGKTWTVGDGRPGAVRDPDISHRRFMGKAQIYVDDDTGTVFATGDVARPAASNARSLSSSPSAKPATDRNRSWPTTPTPPSPRLQSATPSTPPSRSAPTPTQPSTSSTAPAGNAGKIHPAAPAPPQEEGPSCRPWRTATTPSRAS